MNFLVSVLLFIHGFAHLVGFVVTFKLKHFDETPFKTTLFYGKIDLGENGIKIFGLFWLIFSLAFFLSFLGILYEYTWGDNFTLVISILSLILCIFGLPDSKFGILINLLIISLIILRERINIF